MTKRHQRTATQSDDAQILGGKAVVPLPDDPPRPPRENTKQAVMLALLRRPGGASLLQLMEATGWQRHSVRAALALMKSRRGIEIVSDTIEGVRIYRLTAHSRAP
jgi:hypothetical protein